MKNNGKIKKNLLLDEETVEILEDYSTSKNGTKNISSAIRSMSREYRDGKLVASEKPNIFGRKK